MCETCPDETAAAVPSARPPRQRTRLKEIEAQWHCTIIGTCLTLADLQDVAGKMRVTLTKGASDYSLHTAMVHLASRDATIAKALQKVLDRRHVRAINRSRGLTDEAALETFWREAIGEGDVAGACWALMSHAQATDALRSKVFGDVHMLSHQVGATSRQEQRQLMQLTREKTDLTAKLAEQQERLRREKARHTEEAAALREELREARRAARPQPAPAAQTERLAALEGSLAEETARRTEAEEALAVERQVHDEVLGQLARLRQENETLARENRIFETSLAALSDAAALPESGDCPEDCPNACERRLDFCGRCILVVGGRHQHLPHLRRMVEGANGIFAHHDGGLEESMSRLKSLCGQADAVLLPVDCVSHSAQDEVKRLCRRWDKAFVPVRRSGLAAYIAALETLSTTEERRPS